MLAGRGVIAPGWDGRLRGGCDCGEAGVDAGGFGYAGRGRGGYVRLRGDRERGAAPGWGGFWFARRHYGPCFREAGRGRGRVRRAWL